MADDFSYGDAYGAPAASAAAFTDTGQPGTAAQAAFYRGLAHGTNDYVKNPAGSRANPVAVRTGDAAPANQFYVDLDGNLHEPGDPSGAPPAAAPAIGQTPPAPVPATSGAPTASASAPSTPAAVSAAPANGDDFSYTDAYQPQPGSAATDVRPTNEALGFAEGVNKPSDNLAAFEAKTPGMGVSQFVSRLVLHGLGMKTADEMAADRNAALKQQEQTQRPGELGRFAGEVAGTLPAAALPGGPLPQAAISGALLADNPNDPASTALSAGSGALGGYVGSKVLGAIGAAAAPVVRPAVQRLLSAGVPLTPGQIAGGAGKTIEDSLTSWPILGDMIKSAQRRSVAGFNTATANDALSHIGETVPPNVNPGRDTIAHVEGRLGDAYEQIKPHLTADLDLPFVTGVANARRRIAPEALDALPTFDRVFRDEVLQRANPATGMLDGQAAKDAQTAIGQEIAGMSPDPSPKTRAVVSGLRSLQDELSQSMMRNSAPNAADRLSDINAGWAKYARLRDASASASDRDHGLFTPYQFSQAVKKGDKSVGKGARARGTALMQDLATSGMDVLPSTVPDSGTVGRGLIAELPMLLGFGAESKNFGRQIAGLVIGGPALGLPYTSAGQRVAQTALTQRPWTTAQARALVSAARPYAIDVGAVGADRAAKKLPQLPAR